MTVAYVEGVGIPPSSKEFWEVDGVPLHRRGWSIETVGGARFDTPPLRGDDDTYAGALGEQFNPKIPDGRTISLQMWMTGTDPETGLPDGDLRLRFNDNWQFLRTLLWQPDREFTLTRRWWITDPETGTPGIAVADALGQLQSPLVPSMTGRARARFTVDIRLAHPFFYGPTREASLVVGQQVVAHNPGDYRAGSRNLQIALVGPLTTPKLLNLTVNPDIAVTYTGTIADGETVTLDVPNWLAVSNSGYSRGDRIVPAGSVDGLWMSLQRGANTLMLVGAGTGHAALTFRPPYI